MPYSNNTDAVNKPALLLETNKDGRYPVPKTRCGILAFYQSNDQIYWGLVESNRVGPITFSIPAGIQDIIAVTNEMRFTLEVGKPLPDLNIEFLSPYVGQLLRDNVYQDVLKCLRDNQYQIFLEDSLTTALHEAEEEHGLDLISEINGNKYLVKSLNALTPIKLNSQNGSDFLNIWLAYLTSPEGVTLKTTQKIEQKIRRNFGKEFYEKGCWLSLTELKKAYRLEKANYFQEKLSNNLIGSVFESYKQTVKLLETLEKSIQAQDLNIERNTTVPIAVQVNNLINPSPSHLEFFNKITPSKSDCQPPLNNCFHHGNI